MKTHLFHFVLLLFVIPHAYAENLFDLEFTDTQKSNMQYLEREYNLDADLLVTAISYAGNFQKNIKKKHLLTIIDYRLPSTQKRLWVVNIDKMEIEMNLLVSHGKKSGGTLYATEFSNTSGSNQSSVGFFRTAETYKGKHGYSLRLDGLESKYNSRARKRAMIVHGADYMTDQWMKKNKTQQPGRSWGTIALHPSTTKSYIDLVKDGSLIFVYHPSYGSLLDSSFFDGNW